jgi:CheY-like chemotaxis protein
VALRTPLTLIIGPLARIIERENEDKLREQHLLMFRNADRLLKLITRLMDFSKDEQSKLVLQVRKGSIIPTVENVFLSFRFEALHNLIDYQFITNKPIPELWFDNEFVESILFNLISNAFKYTPTNKAVIVHIDKETVDNKPYLCIRISDQGKGISASSLERVFDRFYSGDKLHAGTGIGLSFTKRLVDLHHGLIKVSSELDIGSVFSVLLPLTDVYLVEEKEQAAFQRKEMVINWKKIDSHVASNALESFSRLKQDFEKDQLIALIVDDNADVRIFISDILFENFEVVLAENAEVGFRIASEIIPDIIISDVMMPGMNGFQFCEKLKKDQRTDHIPVILTTVLSSQEDRIEGLRWGADSFIPKPLDPEHLMIRVRKLLERQEKLKKKYQTTVEINATNSGIPQASHETENPQDPFVVEATLCILKNIEKSDFTVDDLCRTIGMSRMQLYRKLKAVTGLSANTFIRKIRLKRAAELLATGKYSVKEVTYDVGFSDLKYFRKCFKEEFGVNPSGYGNEKEDD